MSRAWLRALGDGVTCGNCHRKIPAGTVHLRIQPTGCARGLRRCAFCADEPMPAHVPEAAPPVQDRRPMQMLRFDANSLPLDFKQAAAGREPGDDDEEDLPIED